MNILKQQYLRGVNLESASQVINSISGGVNSGCNLYVGVSTQDSIITVKNTSGDEIIFNNVIQGTVLPFSVIEITDISGIGGLVALW